MVDSLVSDGLLDSVVSAEVDVLLDGADVVVCALEEELEEGLDVSDLVVVSLLDVVEVVEVSGVEVSVELSATDGVVGTADSSAIAAGAAAKVIKAPASTAAARRPKGLRKVRSKKFGARAPATAAQFPIITLSGDRGDLAADGAKKANRSGVTRSTGKTGNAKSPPGDHGKPWQANKS